MKNYRAELTGVFGDPVDDNPQVLWRRLLLQQEI